MDYGELPDQENCEISRWELGTLNYEALAGFCGTEEYLANLAPGVPDLDAAFSAIVEHEEKISARFQELSVKSSLSEFVVNSRQLLDIAAVRMAAEAILKNEKPIPAQGDQSSKLNWTKLFNYPICC